MTIARKHHCPDGSYQLAPVLTIVLSLIVSALAAIFLASHAFAEDIEVRNLSYVNDGGAYQASIELYWKDSDGERKSLKWKDLSINKYINANQNQTVRINQVENGPDEGDEVWLKINIKSGDNPSCRKKTDRYFYSSTGGEAKFKTGGTTLNNNRCKVVCKKCEKQN